MDGVHLGLIAGAGPLPRLVAESRRRSGAAMTVIALDETAVRDLAGHDPILISMAKPGRIEAVLKQAGCTHVTMAGRVTRPDFGALKPDLKGMTLLPKVIAAAGKGDAALLDILIAEFERAGFEVWGAHEWLGALTAPLGRLGGPKPTEQDRADLQKAAQLLRALGPFDVGQACVVSEGLVLAVEAAEGTDAMLERVARLSGRKSAPDMRRGVLWKAPKSIQDERADMPVVGAETLRRAAAAGLGGVCVAADGTLILERDEAVRIAKTEGLFFMADDEERLLGETGGDLR